MKHRKLPVKSQYHSKCKCGHAIQPGETRVKLTGDYDKCQMCFDKGEINGKAK